MNRLIDNIEGKPGTDDKIEAMLLEGLHSGAPIDVDAEYWERKRRQLAQSFSADQAIPSAGPLRRNR